MAAPVRPTREQAKTPPPASPRGNGAAETAARDAQDAPTTAPATPPAVAPVPKKTRTRIKICGITSVAMAQAAVDAGADAIGIVFAPGSPRHVLPGLAMQIARSLPPMVGAVGVFRNPTDADVLNWRGQWVQLHGSEDESQASRLGLQHRRIIKGIAFDATQIVKWDNSQHVTALLIDSATPGSGAAFDHEALAQLMPALRTPVILAGGLTAETVGEAIRVVRPFGVDVSSGVESSKGVKDAGLIRAFCAAVRAADADGMGH
jgi:phosphoribosylanthranilate isomerase